MGWIQISMQKSIAFQYGSNNQLEHMMGGKVSFALTANLYQRHNQDEWNRLKRITEVFSFSVIVMVCSLCVTWVFFPVLFVIFCLRF